MLDKFKLFEEIYGPDNTKQFENFINNYKKNSNNYQLDQTDTFLITYGDSITGEEKGFSTLFSLLDTEINNSIKNVHILPMYPYTSDDGFSVVDYEQVRTDLGTWDELNKAGQKYGLMYDFVINHMSKSSEWFKDYLLEKNNYFIEYDNSFDYTKVVRPRTSPLFHEIDGKKIWTTFSEDQVDLNFEEYKVFEEATRILIDYCSNGATFIRLDAIGFLWKESGTSCIHLENTHKIIKLWRLILDELFGDKYLITETNVPHEENISYFGDGDEAHLVYNFALPPLVADCILSASSKYLSKWLNELESIEGCSYFNFLSSHDGVGLRPVEGILPKPNIDAIVSNALTKSGKINYKKNIDGSESPYECNINYFSLLKENDEFDINRLLCATFILNSIQGCPAIYIHTLLGSENDLVGMQESGINRRINREQLEINTLLGELHNKNSDRAKILDGLSNQLNIRKKYAAFSPTSKQNVVASDDNVLIITRESDFETVTCVVNVSSSIIKLDTEIFGQSIITNKEVRIAELQPYQYDWVIENE